MVKELLSEYGYSDKSIEKIISSYPLANFKEETLFNNILQILSYLKEVGYTKDQIIKMTVSFPSVYSYGIENIKQKINNLENIGYKREQVLKIILFYPMLCGLSIEKIKQKINDLESLGYTKEQIIKMTVFSPSIYGYGIDNIKKKINDLESLGYTKDQIIKMTVLFPPIYGHSTENIKKKINDLESLGYTKDQIIKMTVLFPAVFGFNIDNLKEKILFFKELELEDFFVKSPKRLMQSVDLTYARYRYLTEDKGIEINVKNIDYLFRDAKNFEKQFGISKINLLERYSYDLEVRGKNKSDKALRK